MRAQDIAAVVTDGLVQEEWEKTAAEATAE
jgi:hypothetical protein